MCSSFCSCNLVSSSCMQSASPPVHHFGFACCACPFSVARPNHVVFFFRKQHSMMSSSSAGANGLNPLEGFAKLFNSPFSHILTPASEKATSCPAHVAQIVASENYGNGICVPAACTVSMQHCIATSPRLSPVLVTESWRPRKRGRAAVNVATVVPYAAICSCYTTTFCKVASALLPLPTQGNPLFHRAWVRHGLRSSGERKRSDANLGSPP